METSSAQHNSAEEYNSNAIVEVIPGLWLGGLGALQELRLIPRRWTVISVLHSVRLKNLVKKSLGEIESNASRIENHVVRDLPDHTQAHFLSPRLDEILRIIDSAITTFQPNHPRACLVHCALGKSRSASVIAAWLLSRRKSCTLEETMHFLRRARPEVSPNMGFLAMLRALEQCGGDVSAAMERIKRHKGMD